MISYIYLISCISNYTNTHTYTYASNLIMMALHQVWYPTVMMSAPMRATSAITKLITTSKNALRKVLKMEKLGFYHQSAGTELSIII